MTHSLPLRANLEWLKKLSKERLEELRGQNPHAQLSDAQLAVAREFGFSSWPKLKASVEQLRTELGKLAKAAPGEAPAAADDPDLKRLLAAIEAGDTQGVIALLEQRPILARSSGHGGQFPLHLAARYNDPALCAWLMAYGADPEATFGGSQHTAVSWAVTCNAPECGKVLVKLGAKCDLFCAAGLGLLDVVRVCFDEAGNLLPGTARTGSSRFTADGTRLPCPPAERGEQVSDALAMACRNAQAEVVRLLLTKKPDLAFRGFMGGTALHWAYFGGSSVVIDLLLEAGADPNVRDDVLHCTPRAFGIAVAANWGFDFIVAKLLAGDPRLANAVDRHTSPLHEAARGGHARVIELLLAHNADRELRNEAGQTAAEVAMAGGHTTVVAMLGGGAGTKG
jgi:ankyrin repeat protein